MVQHKVFLPASDSEGHSDATDADQGCRKVFEETMPKGGKPMQLYANGDLIRSIHGASYTRLHDVDLPTMLKEFATDFVPPQESGGLGSSGGSGLYCGEQDMFCFLIDPKPKAPPLSKPQSSTASPISHSE